MTNLRQLARGQECMVRLDCCNHDPSTTVLAHIRRGNPGMGRKPSDWVAVHACSACHDAIDGRNAQYEREAIDSALLYALVRQIEWYVSKEILP